MVPEAIIYQSTAIITAGALSAIAIEARWTHKTVLRHDRMLDGTEHRAGIIELVNEHLRGKNED
ncbi:hypothetical protein [Haloarcula marismortui]|jgi:hypothetical protein|uniref:Uncharacterized protein n=1 Tax=Haloarcula marismortui ATCC 33800 TaxID=662476 RepID=M0JT34_9EURY|nr:hypothetical protein [Haloarcula sinaiiensis]EMA12327.1 hypothetical protein C436_14454 [Haloarcula sinaiiensis ATCC 33800]QUJ71266.1 hypothetical protein KDQ40_11135 [Haloarcula sinaiiensis ATCC 33800]